MKAYEHLVKTALNDGFEIEVMVWDSCVAEPGDNYRGSEYEVIIEEIETVDGGSDFRIWDNDQQIAYVVTAIGSGNDDDETVADWIYIDGSFGENWMGKWFNQYRSNQNEIL
jgi:hypothetical protein